MILTRQLPDKRWSAHYVMEFVHTCFKADGSPRTFRCRKDAIRAATDAWLIHLRECLWPDETGLAAVEAALVLPVLLIAFLGFFQLACWQSMVSSTQWVAQAAAYQATHGGDPAAVVQANAGAFLFGAQASLTGCVSNGEMVTCTVSATMPPLFPVVGLSSFTTTSTATD